MGRNDYFTNVALKECSEKIRNEIRDEATSHSSKLEKFYAVVMKFMKVYEYDYSVLLSPDEVNTPRVPKEKYFDYNGSVYKSSSVTMICPEDKHNLYLSPTVHPLKMGTCATFTRELEWFAKEFGIEYEVVKKPDVCYDRAYHLKPEQRVRDMAHTYMVAKIDDREYKIDIAGAMMAKDYRVDNPKAKISVNDFLFVDKDKENPFVKIKNGDQPGGE